MSILGGLAGGEPGKRISSYKCCRRTCLYGSEVTTNPSSLALLPVPPTLLHLFLLNYPLFKYNVIYLYC